MHAYWPETLADRGSIHQRIRTIVKVGFLLVAIVSTGTPAQSQAPQGSPKTSAQNFAPPSVEPPSDTSGPPINQLTAGDPVEDRLRQLENDMAESKGKSDAMEFITVLVLAVLGAFLTLFSVLSVLGSIFAERRTRETHSLAIAGETASQGRSDEVHRSFLQSSKDTLDLVNATLTLAKEASERAASVIERKARATLSELDSSAKELLLPTEDDRALIETPAARSLLNSPAARIEAFEINSFVFPEDILPTPHCLFIRGMSCHLEQQFSDALQYWRTVALATETPSDLRSQAWYWIGYEHNNLGRFEDAEKSFRSVLEGVSGARSFELRRIMIESRFFDHAHHKPSELVPQLENLLAEIEVNPLTDEYRKRHTKIKVTLANILVRAHVEQGDAGDNYLSKARVHFEQVKSFDKWALLGLAETLFLLGEQKNAIPLFSGPVRRNAIDEYVRRTEPRTKVLARTTELLCCARVPELRDEIPSVYGNLVDVLGQVDERMTIYSQFQKRNVRKDEFLQELNNFIETEGLRSSQGRLTS